MVVLNQRGAAAGGGGATQGLGADAAARAAGWMHTAACRCGEGASRGGAGARGCGGGHGCQECGESEEGVLGAQMEFLPFLHLVNRPVFLNGRELNCRGRYRDSLFQR